jgi:hypothetical protein
MNANENLYNNKIFPAKVVKVMDFNYKLVINRGAKDGVKMGQRFLIYSIGEEILDPDTKESLGKLEIVRGKGKVIHVQEKMATLESERAKSERTIKKNSNSVWKSVGASEEEVITPTKEPFDQPDIGDSAKPL